MITLQTLTLGMYIIVVLFWLTAFFKLFPNPRAAPKSDKRNLIILTVIVLALTAMQVIGPGQ